MEETLEFFNEFRLFFNHFFTSIMLVQPLEGYGIYCRGIVKNNQIGQNVPIKSTKKLAKEKRETLEGCLSEDRKMSLVMNVCNIVCNK